MADAHSGKGSEDRTAFADEVAAKAARKLAARHDPAPGVWFGLGMMGLVGWSVALPTVVGVIVGMWLDRRQAGEHSWTLALLVAGLVVGCMNAWHWVGKEQAAMRGKSSDDDA